MKTLYDTLEVSPAASPEVIAATHRTLARRLHPDNKETGDAARFREITTAWAVLKDAKKRASYDQFLENERRKAAAATAPPQQPVTGTDIPGNFDQAIVDAASRAVVEQFGHIPGIRELAGAFRAPARKAVRDMLGAAGQTLRRGRPQ